MNPEQQEQQRMEQRVEAANLELEKALKKIFSKPIQNLSLDDKRFLQARRSYLDESQTKKYEKILSEKLPRPDGKEEEKTLDEMAREDLLIMAKREGVRNPDKIKKNEDLIKAIQKKQEEKEE